MLLFKQFIYEEVEKGIVTATLRAQPPHKGHEKLINRAQELADQKGHDLVIRLSHSHDHRENPIPPEKKLSHLQKLFPHIKFELSSKKDPTFLSHAANMYDKGYKHYTLVASGDDRVPIYKEKLKQFHGKMFNFKTANVVEVKRDPAAKGTVEGLSGTGMRKAAQEGDFESFKRGLAGDATDDHAREIFNDVRQGLEKPPRKKSVKEELSFLYFLEGKQQSSGELSFMGYTTKNLDQCPMAYKKFKEMIDNFEPEAQPLSVTAANMSNHVDMSNVEKHTMTMAGIAAKPRHIKMQQAKHYLNL